MTKIIIKTCIASISVLLMLLSVTACVGGSNSASGTGTAGISSIGATAADGNSGSSGNEKYSPTSTMLIANWTLDGERTPVYNLYDMGWHILTLTATQVIGGPINIQGLIGTVEPNPLYHCGQTVQIQDINCDYATFAESGDHCSAYIRISYNYESYNYQQCNVTVKFQPRNFSIGNNVNITDRMQAQNSAADYRIVHDFESAYYSGSKVAADIKRYRIISLANGSLESVAVGEITAPSNQAFTLMNRTESKDESDPYYGTWNQCAVNANHALGQVATLNNLNESCMLVYHAARLENINAESVETESANVTIYTNAQNVFPYNAGNYMLQATYGTQYQLNWEAVNSLPTSQTWNSIAYGNSKFVAISNSNVGAVSSDGKNWQQMTLPGNNWSSITYGESKFVAVTNGNNSIGTVSTDGINWTTTNLPNAESEWFAVTYGNGNFVAVGSGNIGAISSDGINWQTMNMPYLNSEEWMSVSYGNNEFVALGDGAPALGAISSDGVNWTQVNVLPLPGGCGWASITYGNGLFMALNGSTTIGISSNGMQWESSFVPIVGPSQCWTASIAYGSGIFLVTNTSNLGQAAFSTDGFNWQLTTLPLNMVWRIATYGNGMFIVLPMYDSSGIGAKGILSNFINFNLDSQ